MTAPAPVAHVSKAVTLLSTLYTGQSGVLEHQTFVSVTETAELR